MTLDKVIETLKKMYEAALKMPFVFDPLAWALRGTWKLYLALPDSTISMFQVQDAPDANAGDTVSKKAVELALLEKGQSSERYKIGEIWELNFDEIREALATVPPAQPEQRWIPVAERLPEKGQKCLVSDKGHIAIDVFLGRGGAYNWQFYVRDYEAWMPLVQPYKEEEE